MFTMHCSVTLMPLSCLIAALTPCYRHPAIERNCRSPVSRILSSLLSQRCTIIYLTPQLWRTSLAGWCDYYPGILIGRATLPLLCLAPRGVYHASSVTLGAVGSYPTISPLPWHSWERRAVCFLLHFPSDRLEPAVPCYSQGALPYGVRTFLNDSK